MSRFRQPSDPSTERLSARARGGHAADRSTTATNAARRSQRREVNWADAAPQRPSPRREVNWEDAAPPGRPAVRRQARPFPLVGKTHPQPPPEPVLGRAGSFASFAVADPVHAPDPLSFRPLGAGAYEKFLYTNPVDPGAEVFHRPNSPPTPRTPGASPPSLLKGRFALRTLPPSVVNGPPCLGLASRAARGKQAWEAAFKQIDAGLYSSPRCCPHIANRSLSPPRNLSAAGLEDVVPAGVRIETDLPPPASVPVFSLGRTPGGFEAARARQHRINQLCEEGIHLEIDLPPPAPVPVFSLARPGRFEAARAREDRIKKLCEEGIHLHRDADDLIVGYTLLPRMPAGRRGAEGWTASPDRSETAPLVDGASPIHRRADETPPPIRRVSPPAACPSEDKSCVSANEWFSPARSDRSPRAARRPRFDTPPADPPARLLEASTASFFRAADEVETVRKPLLVAFEDSVRVLPRAPSLESRRQSYFHPEALSQAPARTASPPIIFESSRTGTGYDEDSDLDLASEPRSAWSPPPALEPANQAVLEESFTFARRSARRADDDPELSFPADDPISEPASPELTSSIIFSRRAQRKHDRQLVSPSPEVTSVALRENSESSYLACTQPALQAARTSSSVPRFETTVTLHESYDYLAMSSAVAALQASVESCLIPKEMVTLEEAVDSSFIPKGPRTPPPVVQLEETLESTVIARAASPPPPVVLRGAGETVAWRGESPPSPEAVLMFSRITPRNAWKSPDPPPAAPAQPPPSPPAPGTTAETPRSPPAPGTTPGDPRSPLAPVTTPGGPRSPLAPGTTPGGPRSPLPPGASPLGLDGDRRSLSPTALVYETHSKLISPVKKPLERQGITFPILIQGQGAGAPSLQSPRVHARGPPGGIRLRETPEPPRPIATTIHFHYQLDHRDASPGSCAPASVDHADYPRPGGLTGGGQMPAPVDALSTNRPRADSPEHVIAQWAHMHDRLVAEQEQTETLHHVLESERMLQAAGRSRQAGYLTALERQHESLRAEIGAHRDPGLQEAQQAQYAHLQQLMEEQQRQLVSVVQQLQQRSSGADATEAGFRPAGIDERLARQRQQLESQLAILRDLQNRQVSLADSPSALAKRETNHLLQRQVESQLGYLRDLATAHGANDARTEMARFRSPSPAQIRRSPTPLSPRSQFQVSVRELSPHPGVPSPSRSAVADQYTRRHETKATRLSPPCPQGAVAPSPPETVVSPYGSPPRSFSPRAVAYDSSQVQTVLVDFSPRVSPPRRGSVQHACARPFCSCYVGTRPPAVGVDLLARTGSNQAVASDRPTDSKKKAIRERAERRVAHYKPVRGAPLQALAPDSPIWNRSSGTRTRSAKPVYGGEAEAESGTCASPPNRTYRALHKKRASGGRLKQDQPQPPPHSYSPTGSVPGAGYLLKSPLPMPTV
ncbi:hypothetical protein DIPPA_02894 [Diplonema papillatum]|nr:hypothetical protein DIPPA_02894 [Diplonema papillatum]